jgi:hypothetical protein
MTTLVNRALSLLVYFGYLVSAYHFGGVLGTAKIAAALLLALVCLEPIS